MLIKIKVLTSAKKEKVVKKSAPTLSVGAPTESVGEYKFEISVKEPAERGLANEKVIKLLRNEFKGYNKIRIVSGHHSPSKIISLEK